MNQKVAIYCRLSEEDKNKQNVTDDSGSIQNQKAMLCDYARGMCWDLYGIYSDDDYTGADRNRPEFKRLLADAEAKKFEIVLCKTQSRFTRELELVEKYIHGLFPLWGIRFVSIVDNADTANKGNKKSRQINGLVNEWYLEDMSDSIKSALDSRRRNGFHIGSFALYGYKKDPHQRGHLIIDEPAAEIVREVFSLYAQGYGRAAIARILNERKIPNPTEYKRQCGLRYQPAATKNSTLWRYPAISDMLSNQMYIGNMVQGKSGSVSYKTKKVMPRPKDKWYIVEGTHEPIIDRELWFRVQEKMGQRAKPFADGTTGIFSKKVFCSECGYTLRSSKNHGKYYLQCATRYASKGACGGCFISVSVLERAVIDELNCITDEYLDRDELERSVELTSNLKKRKTELETTLAEAEKSRAQNENGIRTMYMDRVRGRITEHEFDVWLADMRKESKGIEGRILQLQRQLQEIDERMESGNDNKKIIEKYIHPEHLTREMTEALIDKIEISRNPLCTKQISINIHWKF